MFFVVTWGSYHCNIFVWLGGRYAARILTLIILGFCWAGGRYAARIELKTIDAVAHGAPTTATITG